MRFPYESFLDRHANASQRARWDAMHGRFALTAEQRELLAGFVRRMPVLCLAGAWCGDCINQCPVFDHFARASTQIDLRFLDRDVNPLIRDPLSVNGGQRVPVVVFLSEDWFEVSRVMASGRCRSTAAWPPSSLDRLVQRDLSLRPTKRSLPSLPIGWPSLNAPSLSSGSRHGFVPRMGIEAERSTQGANQIASGPTNSSITPHKSAPVAGAR